MDKADRIYLTHIDKEFEGDNIQNDLYQFIFDEFISFVEKKQRKIHGIFDKKSITDFFEIPNFFCDFF